MVFVANISKGFEEKTTFLIITWFGHRHFYLLSFLVVKKSIYFNWEKWVSQNIFLHFEWEANPKLNRILKNENEC